MAAILYYLILIPFSRLPWKVIYAISDFIAFLLEHVFRYRKKTIKGNVNRSFPEKTEKEKKQIIHRFYHHFADQWMETLKLFTISEEEAVKRCKIVNPDFLTQFKGKDVITVMGHYNNWEFIAVSVGPQIEHLPIAIYSPVKNKFFDKKMLESRSKFGMKMIPKYRAKRSIKDEGDPPAVIFFVADQSGLTSKKVYWMPFLNQESAVVTGPERYARMHDSPVVFLEVRKIKRGFYEGEFIRITDDPSKQENGEISVRHVKHLEKVIREEPSFWLWSHKRWKKGKLPTNQIEYDLKSILKKLEDEKKESNSPTD